MRAKQLHLWRALGRRVAPFALVAVLGLTAGFALWAIGRPSVSVVPDPTSGRDEVLLGGTRVTLQEAAAGVGFSILRPDSPLASDDTLVEVWLASGEGGAVALVYELGVRVYLSTWPVANPMTPEQFYQQQAAVTGAGWTENINGVSAWVAPANAQAPGLPPESIIDFVVDGVEVSVRGGSFSADELMEVARSIPQPTG